jgi:quercetin dioxygenase-like cupin family protein
MVYGIAGEGVLVLGDNEKSIPISRGVLVTVETGVAHDVIAKPNLSILVFKLIGDKGRSENHEKHEVHEKKEMKEKVEKKVKVEMKNLK